MKCPLKKLTEEIKLGGVGSLPDRKHKWGSLGESMAYLGKCKNKQTRMKDVGKQRMGLKMSAKIRSGRVL